MTGIAGMIDKGKGYMASDSLGSSSYTKTPYKNKKIIKKKNMLIGYTSSYRMGQLLEYKFKLPSREDKQTLDQWLYNDFVDEIRKVMKDGGFSNISENEESIGTFLIIIEGRLFKFQHDMSIIEPQKLFDSCGSGEDYAKSAIRNLKNHTKKKPKDILREAVSTASEFVPSVGGDIQIEEI